MVTNIHTEGSVKSNNTMAPAFIQAIKTRNPASNDDQTFVVNPKKSDIIIPYVVSIIISKIVTHDLLYRIMGPTGFGKSRVNYFSLFVAREIEI